MCFKALQSDARTGLRYTADFARKCGSIEVALPGARTCGSNYERCSSSRSFSVLLCMQEITPTLVHVEVQFEDGRLVSITKLVLSTTEVRFIARQLWRELIPHMTWPPIQRRVVKMKDCGLSTLAQLQLLRAANVVSGSTSTTTIITPEAVVAMLEGRAGLSGILEQLGVAPVAGSSSVAIPR